MALSPYWLVGQPFNAQIVGTSFPPKLRSFLEALIFCCLIEALFFSTDLLFFFFLFNTASNLILLHVWPFGLSRHVSQTWQPDGGADARKWKNVLLSLPPQILKRPYISGQQQSTLSLSAVEGLLGFWEKIKWHFFSGGFICMCVMGFTLALIQVSKTAQCFNRRWSLALGLNFVFAGQWSFFGRP